MAKNAKLGDARAHLSKLVMNIQEGGDIDIGPDGEALPRLAGESKKPGVREAIDRIRASRRKNGRATAEEILQWRDEGRR